MNSKSNSTEKIGILLIGHGSSLPQSNDVIYKLSSMYKETSPYPVEMGFMNIEKPSIPTALNALAGKGVNKIIAAPIFLAHGLHTKEDIPYMLGLGEARKDAGYYNEKQEVIEFDGEIVYIEPIGADPRIVDVIKKRVKDSCGLD
ncbi:sirohydrochlorin nickelochelatase [Methanobacterium sp.]|uniref:sirohydrochlorin nickelochelatase n=1 Tax=Methanobacterium sp. TaxID=2164 RepID=UPI0025E61E75|nr:sirohydrochlorin nickelochelatase [Methanobacterium sp.]MBI5458815.1 sirohydrochlorin nickelochelatase [Methanobacterium sp.]